MIIVNGFQPLTIIITKHSILDAAVALDPPLHYNSLSSLDTDLQALLDLRLELSQIFLFGYLNINSLRKEYSALS